MASKQCHFPVIWLQEQEFAAWLQQTKGDSNGCCKLCRKLFDISNMGIGAVKSHMKSKQHNQITKHKQSPFTQSITDFFGKTNKSAPTTNNLVNKFNPLWLFLNIPVMCVNSAGIFDHIRGSVECRSSVGYYSNNQSLLI